MLANVHQPVQEAKRVRRACSTDHANTKSFEYKTNIEVRPVTKRHRFKAIMAKVASAGLTIYSSLRSIIYSFKPRAEGWSRPRTWSPSHAMGRRPRQISETAGDNTGRGFKHRHRLYPAGGEPLLLVPSLYAFVAKTLVSE